MLLIAGTKVSEDQIGSGTFNCPYEGSPQQYRHVRLQKKATAFFVPVVNLSDIGEYVQCQSCGSTFNPEVLTRRTQEELDTALAIAITTLAIEVILADGRVTTQEREVALEIANKYLDPPGASMEEFSEMIAALEAKTAGRRARNSTARLADLAAHLTMDARKTLLHTAYLLAAADCKVDETELEVIAKAARSIGFSRAEARTLMAEFATTFAD